MQSIMMHTITKKVTRFVIMTSVFYLPKARKRRVERWVRGREQMKKLRRADCVIVSFGKSGRTWLRVMMSRFYQLKHGLSERHLIGFDNLNAKNRAIPKVFFTHDNYLKDYTGNADSKADYRDSKVVLLVRNPADVAVSQYFQWRYRMKPKKMTLNRYPEQGSEVSQFDFVMDQDAGLPKIIGFMNAWARAVDELPNLLIVRYEDMKAQPERELGRIVEFIGTPGTPEQIEGAVAFASFENMRQMEEKKTFWLSGGRMVPKDRSNPNSFKTRRAKVGGYLDDFSADEVARIRGLIDSELSPVFGYRSEGEARAEAASA